MSRCTARSTSARRRPGRAGGAGGRGPGPRTGSGMGLARGFPAQFPELMPTSVVRPLRRRRGRLFLGPVAEDAEFDGAVAGRVRLQGEAGLEVALLIPGRA